NDPADAKGDEVSGESRPLRGRVEWRRRNNPANPDLMYPSVDADGQQMPQNRPELTEADSPGQVLLFRRRRLSRPSRRAARDPTDPTNESADDLAQYEQDEEIDYRHRML